MKMQARRKTNSKNARATLYSRGIDACFHKGLSQYYARQARPSLRSDSSSGRTKLALRFACAR